MKIGSPLNPEEGPCILKKKDRPKHLLALGGTGSGKTTLFLNLIKQELDEAIIVLDPHGGLAESVAGMAPRDRLVYVDKYHPLSLNPLARDYLSRSEIASELRDIVNASVQAVSPQQVEISRKMHRIILMALQVLGDNISLEYLSNFLDSKTVREKFFSNNDKPLFWREFDKDTYEAREWRMSAGRITDRLAPLHEHEIFKHFIGETNDLDIPDVAEDKKIVVFNFGDLDNDLTNFIGNIISHQIRSYYQHQAKRDGPSLYFYVDEYHLFITSLFDRFLTECRQYNISCNFAGHFLFQVDKRLASAVTQCHTLAVLDPHPDDAETIAKILNVTPEYLRTGKFEAVIGLGKEPHYVRLRRPPDVEPYRPEPVKEEEGYYWLKDGWILAE